MCRLATEVTSTPDAPLETGEPTSRPTRDPAVVVTLSEWSCKTGSISDPLQGRWRISRTSWGSGASTDRVTFTLTRLGSTSRPGVTVELKFMSPAKAASTFGVTKPDGERALVLTFDGPVNVGTPMVGKPAMDAIESVDVRRDDSGVTHAILGVTGAGCARLNAPDWRSGSDDITTASLLIDVRR